MFTCFYLIMRYTKRVKAEKTGIGPCRVSLYKTRKTLFETKI